ncbi:DUF1501 domain-containing protein [Akkermansiaceae bacterium]|nr:DUF1501 domain-containing protein [Akkermansiaceae bacterium]MDB4541479.1 DUF1501 domain-containing protein [Akkermansiaceae bacterium]
MSFCGNTTRRELLQTLGGGFPALALSGLMAKKIQESHFAPKAKSVIFLFMYGGPSHIDTFDYKPMMYGMDGKTVEVKTFGRGGKKDGGRIVEPKWKFKQHGQSGKWVSSLFPNVAECVDDISFIHSMKAESPIHGSAMLMMNSGSLISGKPSLGSWVNYGLGSVNENLPGYVVMLDKSGGPISGAKNWSAGFMPANYQGTVFRSKGDPILDLKNARDIPRDEQHRLIQSLNQLNEKHRATRYHNSDLAARIESYELAYKMQSTAPEAIELAQESEETKNLYGVNEDRTREFGTKCLLARRLVERGTRFIQLYSGGSHNDHNWDAHGDLEHNHNLHAGATDKPIAGLLKDLKRSGLLDETLVVWGGEFGRQPTAEYAKGTGRDHNSAGFTMWMAGGGIKGGISVGQTDELGSAAVERPLEVKELHATILHQMGLDPNDLSYHHAGLDEKLVGVEGAEPIHEIIA